MNSFSNTACIANNHDMNDYCFLLISEFGLELEGELGKTEQADSQRSILPTVCTQFMPSFR
jgi:hypothetical protein